MSDRDLDRLIREAMQRPGRSTRYTTIERGRRYGRPPAASRRRKALVRAHPSIAARVDGLETRALVWQHELALAREEIDARAASRRPVSVYDGHRRTYAGGYDQANGSVDPARLDASIWDVMRATGWTHDSVLAASIAQMVPCLWISARAGYVFVLEDVLRVYREEWPLGPAPRSRASVVWRPLPLLSRPDHGFRDVARTLRVSTVDPLE